MGERSHAGRGSLNSPLTLHGTLSRIDGGYGVDPFSRILPQCELSLETKRLDGPKEM